MFKYSGLANAQWELNFLLTRQSQNPIASTHTLILYHTLRLCVLDTFIIAYFAMKDVADVGKVGIVEKNSSKNRVSSTDACFEC